MSDLKKEGSGALNRRRIAVESASEPPRRRPEALQERALLELGSPVALVNKDDVVVSLECFGQMSRPLEEASIQDAVRSRVAVLSWDTLA
ncbi:hypothetical protein [Cupriavidus sp. WS]|uniref:hypothetical protein n=1 Tax=Cupriavidus sp. WS TaxID=1312922 RepID=UPI0012DDBA4E|nr:hypothetical protein [Cupriavidus sp. WS]